ncbi:mitochondrial outer membrane protein porin of 36 kDa-like [Cucumis melo var. makuwa]|uniref:Mitochondrial outer membrane protein porin of 36 kDa-like n=1 Tax=Cucumis melo var. makuwa TaxID=1194695 RepID=A0A5A7SSU1_CUCMM|nr:mitochondrial outer membrane protein porin of 36 kDa-like [Cucumis melo var. makuwa]TYK13519.1 mitochondrial outer membrane protein porin of 36 kDa-like [Cucumis melo var. makuwa]
MTDDKPIMDQIHEYENLVANVLYEGMKMCEILQVNILLKKFLPSWNDYQNHLKHKKDLKLQELISHMCTKEVNKLKDKLTSINSINANLVEYSAVNNALQEKFVVARKQPPPLPSAQARQPPPFRSHLFRLSKSLLRHCKKARDLLYKDYQSDHEFTVTTYTAGGVAISSTGVKKGDIFLVDVSTQLKNNNITTDVKVGTHSNVHTIVTIDELAPGLKTIFSFRVPNQRFARSTGIGLTASPIVNFADVIGNETLTWNRFVI